MNIRVTVVALAAAVALGSCHQLANPVDPNSPFYIGVPTDSTPPSTADSPARVLPKIDSWKIAAQHGVGNWVGLPVAADGSYVEPRRPTMSPEFLITAHFSEDVTQEMFDGGIYVWGYTDGSSTSIASIAFEALHPESRTVVLRIDAIPPVCRSRIKFVDRNGAVAGEVNLSFLSGDIDGSEVVDTADVNDIQPLDGQLATAANPAAARADINASGVVDGSAGGSDYDDVNTAYWNNSVGGIAFPDF